ncbi:MULTISPECIES: SDR family oxidoreductase [unclassified Paenibacillus]|uniref:SDR family NAD(P)-dependent oxidoreductase n=1 Tax=unclassified Paenibacillus TaxID=185978 RepID=UPI00104B5A84|nr:MULTISPECIES: SDR family oxidoreductase [unclassified Paenibacillus]NIK71405.1 3-oxoacyl-[acyl-carrier protein] reductase [Paenibacillus sp. BK720]TCM96878.1 3-oxoacyl-[acyl-carrier protein] reductase [Paenibacillus sp. BK033]
MPLQGKVAIVTGGAQGIGRAACIQLAKQGAKVAVSDFERDLTATVSEIKANGGEAVAIPADARSKEQMEQLAQTVIRTFGRIDVLVCGARQIAGTASFAEHSWETFKRELTNELKAVFEPTKAVIGVMTEQQSGRIIYLSGTEGKDPTPHYIAFGTAKGGLDSFARYIAQEYGPYGISANVVAPGFVRSDEAFMISEEESRVIGGFTPLGRIAEPEDVAGVIAFLAGDGARFLTGTYTPVAGGLVME